MVRYINANLGLHLLGARKFPMTPLAHTAVTAGICTPVKLSTILPITQHLHKIPPIQTKLPSSRMDLNGALILAIQRLLRVLGLATTG